jgi:hypothetical protein
MDTVILYVKLSQNFGSSLEYDAEKREMSAHCVAQGYV